MDEISWLGVFIIIVAILAVGGVTWRLLLDTHINAMELFYRNRYDFDRLKQLGAETSETIKPYAQNMICKACLTHCIEHTVKPFLFAEYTYYGCRTCGQHRDIYKIWKDVIAVLDNRNDKRATYSHGELRANWLVERKLFDFDTVEIIRASDEDVERFAVQVGNDTDPLRKDRYPSMTCTIAASANLSENTLRILERTFGTVRKL